MNIQDLFGVGEVTQGLAKLADSVKGFFIWSKEPSRFKQLLEIVSNANLNAESIVYKTPTVELKIEGKKSKEKAEYVERALQAQGSQIVKEQLNTDKVMLHAMENLKDVTTVSDEKIDDEWLAAFFEQAKFATSEYMQKLWGKILSDEVQKPNSYSIRALNTLRFLRKIDAENFANLCHLVLSNCNKTYHIVICDNIYIHQKFHITDSDLAYLEELGLIQSRPLSYPGGILVNNERAVFTYLDKHVFKYESSNLQVAFMDVPFFSLTRLGNELLKLVNPIYHEDYINIIRKLLIEKPHQQQQECKLSIADITALEFKEGIPYIRDSLFSRIACEAEPVIRI